MSLRTMLLIYCLGLGLGTLSHLVDIVLNGWLPYDFAPLAFNLYWTALTLLDPLCILLLLSKRRWGLIVLIAIMVTEVAINAYATARGLLAGGFAYNASLWLQAAFLLFVLLTARRVWRG